MDEKETTLFAMFIIVGTINSVHGHSTVALLEFGIAAGVLLSGIIFKIIEWKRRK